MFIHSVVPSKTIPDSRPKWAKCISVFRPKRHKNLTQWGGTYYLYGLYKGVAPSPPPHPGFLQALTIIILCPGVKPNCPSVQNLNQGCALAEPGGPWRLTFALGQLENHRFFIQIICWAP